MTIINIVGRHKATRKGWDKATGETWMMAHDPEWKSADKVFEAHSPEIVKRWKQWTNMPGYTRPALHEIAEVKPLISQHYFSYMDGHPNWHQAQWQSVAGVRTIESSIGYMMAIALTYAPEKINLFGVNLSAREEYHHQRPNLCHLIGLAEGMGIEVVLPEQCELFKSPWPSGYYGAAFEEINPEIYKEDEDLLKQNVQNVFIDPWEIQFSRQQNNETFYGYMVWVSDHVLEFFGRPEKAKDYQARNEQRKKTAHQKPEAKFLPSCHIEKSKEDLIKYAASQVSIEGMVCEFGVYEGASLKIIRSCFNDEWVYAFDSFEGLPEPWVKSDKITAAAGTFKTNNPPLMGQVGMYAGLFEETLPEFCKQHSDEKIKFAHIDCDIYSSTKTVLENIKPHLVSGSILLFDELGSYEDADYDNWQEGEWKALKESDIPVEIIARTTHEQAVVRVL